MAIFIPTPQVAYSEIDVTLGGQAYSIIYTYNEIDERWRLSLYDSVGNPIIEGIKILEDEYLLWRYNLDEFDHGDIACVKFAPNSDKPVTWGTLGINKEYTLVYYTNTEINS